MRFLMILLLTAGVSLFSLGAVERLEIGALSRFQPAEKSTVPPVAERWSKPAASWNAVAGSFKTPRNRVHSIWQETNFPVPAVDGRRFELDFSRINGNAIVFLNGRRVGERLGPYGKIEVTGFVRSGDNTMRLFLTRDYTDISRKFEQDLLRYFARGPKSVWGTLETPLWALGIDAPVALLAYPAAAAVTDGWVETSVRRKTITLHAELSVDRPGKPLTLSAEILDAAGRVALTLPPQTVTPNRDKAEYSMTQSWSNPTLWEVDAPYLYRARITVRVPGGTTDSHEFTFGFREVWTAGRHLMLNGHVQRLRMDWSQNGYTSPNGLTLLRQLGRNAIYYQSNPTGWWRNWSEVYYFPPGELDLMDRSGVAVFLPVPSCNYGREQFFDNPAYLRQYRTELEAFIRRYRNHPSILAWCVSMISFAPRDGIHPATIGQRTRYSQLPARVVNFAAELTRKIDPTRLAYGHAEGNTGDLASGNTYPNWMPLQEVEDYGERYVRDGNMPWWACEYGLYNGSFFKGKQFYGTEYAAISLGPEAYRLENDTLRDRITATGQGNRGHGEGLDELLPVFPAYWRIQRNFYRATNRAWRTDGILGWHYFDFAQGFGMPPNHPNPKRWQNRYRELKAPLTGRPSWANPLFDIYRDQMDNLLLYLGGASRHTDKTHSYYGGETVAKNLIAVWDGPGKMELRGSIRLRLGDRTVEQQPFRLELAPGDIKNLPFRFTAPAVSARTPAELTLEGVGNGTVYRDRFAIELFPAFRAMPPGNGRVRLYDPKQRSGWVRELVNGVTGFQPGERVKSDEILVIGREALTVGDDLPVDAATLAAGAKIVILEQRPEVWEAMGFRSIEPGTRAVFANSPRLPSAPEDLRFWRGTPDLTPEFKHARAYDVTMPPKSSNRHNVASTMLEIPTTPGFSPLAVGEFDMNYAALLEYRCGKGKILYSTFDFSGRVPGDPAAAQMARILLESAAGPVEANRLCFAGPEAKSELASALPETGTGEFDRDPRHSLLLLAGRDAMAADRLRKFVGDGGRIVLLDSELTASFGWRVAAPESCSTGDFGDAFAPNLQRWRERLSARRLDGGRLFDRRGGVTALQVRPSMFAARAFASSEQRESVMPSLGRLRQLLAQTLTVSGVKPNTKVTERLLKIRKGLAFQPLNHWFVFGPFTGKSLNASENLNAVYPGEAQALAGDLNPNTTYRNGKGELLDFRKTVSANAEHFIDLGAAFKADTAQTVGYAIKLIECERPHQAMLRLGADYFFQLYVNGKMRYDGSRGHGAPKPNAFQVKINLKSGENVIVLKVMAGSKGFGFWANLSEPGMDFGRAVRSAEQDLLYDPAVRLRSPYEYFYW